MDIFGEYPQHGRFSYYDRCPSHWGVFPSMFCRCSAFGGSKSYGLSTRPTLFNAGTLYIGVGRRRRAPVGFPPPLSNLLALSAKSTSRRARQAKFQRPALAAGGPAPIAPARYTKILARHPSGRTVAPRVYVAPRRIHRPMCVIPRSGEWAYLANFPDADALDITNIVYFGKSYIRLLSAEVARAADLKDTRRTIGDRFFYRRRPLYGSGGAAGRFWGFRCRTRTPPPPQMAKFPPRRAIRGNFQRAALGEVGAVPIAPRPTFGNPTVPSARPKGGAARKTFAAADTSP